MDSDLALNVAGVLLRYPRPCSKLCLLSGMGRRYETKDTQAQPTERHIKRHLVIYFPVLVPLAAIFQSSRNPPIPRLVPPSTLAACQTLGASSSNFA